jgi:hypothetical protein
VTRGSIYGKLHDHEGVEIAKGLVHFKPSDPAERGSSSTMADSSGDYQMTLRPGSWDVLFAGKPSRTGSGSVLMGRVDVLAGQEHMLDYYELGERKIEGGFYCEDLDMLLLSVEVSLARDASILIGKASAFTDHGETDTYLKGMEAETEDERPAIRNLTPGMGGFAFRGLSAEEYEIRAYLDVERRFYISTFVDLTSADFEFEPIGLTQIDFISKRVLEVSRRGD